VLKWVNNQCSQQGLELTTENRRLVIGEAVYDLRLLALSEQPFAEHVSTSGLLTDDELVVIYEKFNDIDSPSLKWILPEREKTFKTTETRISRFPNDSDSIVGGYSGSWEYNGQSTDTLSFSVDQFVLFLGVRLFGYSSEYYNVDLTVNNEKLIRGRYRADKSYAGIKGFDVMFKSPMVVKENDVVEMEATISGRASSYGWRGEPKVTVEGLTVTFIDSCSKKRTCVSQGQFHQLILSV
jgi:BTB/POZ domain-containing protein 3/6